MLTSSLAKSQKGIAVVDLDDRRSEDIVRILRDANFEAKAFRSFADWLERRAGWSGSLLMGGDLETAVEVPRALAEHGVTTPILYVDTSTETTTHDIGHAIHSGVFDFLSWPTDRASLPVRMMRALEANATRDRIRSRLASVMDRVGCLTRRQRQVMHLVAQGHPNKIVSWELGISERTVEVHRAEAMRRVGADSLPQLVLLDLAASCFENGQAWSVHGWSRGLEAMIDSIAPLEDCVPDRRVA